MNSLKATYSILCIKRTSNTIRLAERPAGFIPSYARILATLLIILSSICAHSQKWEQRFGTPGINDYGVDIIEAYDHGYLISAGISGECGFLIKTDINGNMLWNKHFIDQHPYSLMQFPVLNDNHGNIYHLGWRVETNSGWPVVIKLDSCGNHLWCRQFIDDDYWWGWIQDALLLDNGDILAVTHMESQNDINIIFLYYITADGELKWKKPYASKNDHPLMVSSSPQALQLVNNMYIISGNCYYAYPDDPMHGYLRPLIVGIDTSFQEQFVLPFGMADSIIGRVFNTVAINDTLLMAVGDHWLFSDQIQYDNSLLAFFDTQGNEVEYKDILNHAIDTNVLANEMRQAIRINDSLFLGTTYHGDQYEGNDNGEIVFDTAGNVYHHVIHPNTGYPPDIIKTHDGKFVVITSEKINDWDVLFYKFNDTLGSDTVYNGNYKYDTLCPYPILSDTIDISSCLITTHITSMPLLNQQNNSLIIYPNPASSFVTLKFEVDVPGRYLIELYNSTGQPIFRLEEYYAEGIYEEKLNTQDMNPGIYFCSLRSDKEIIGVVKILKGN